LHFSSIEVKVKQSLYRPGQALRVPGQDRTGFQDIQHMNVVRLSALPPREYPWYSFLLDPE